MFVRATLVDFLFLVPRPTLFWLATDVLKNLFCDLFLPTDPLVWYFPEMIFCRRRDFDTNFIKLQDLSNVLCYCFQRRYTNDINMPEFSGVRSCPILLVLILLPLLSQSRDVTASTIGSSVAGSLCHSVNIIEIFGPLVFISKSLEFMEFSEILDLGIYFISFWF